MATIKPPDRSHYFPPASTAPLVSVRQLDDDPAVNVGQEDVIRMLHDLKNDIHMLKSAPPNPRADQQNSPTPPPPPPNNPSIVENNKTWSVTIAEKGIMLNLHVSRGMILSQENYIETLIPETMTGRRNWLPKFQVAHAPLTH